MVISQQRRNFILGVGAFVSLATLHIAFAEDDAVHMVSGMVKHLDKDSKTIVLKADDGTEHTIKWTEKTTMEGVKDADKDLKEGSHLTVKYTEKGGEKTAVGIKKVGKDAKKAAE
jgi:Cu/Ag efflux protein CusF